MYKGYLIFVIFLFNVAYSQNECSIDNSLLVNVGSSLKEISQEDLLQGQCKKYYKEFKHRSKSIKTRTKRDYLSQKEYQESKVLCGKYIFLNLGLKSKIGIPTKILKSIEAFDEIGDKLSNTGLLSDESWREKRWPFGIVKTKNNTILTVKTLVTKKVQAISCAACHTGRLSDGRYAIGATNEKFKYGKFNIYLLYSIWLADKRKYSDQRWLPELIDFYQTLDLDRFTKFISFSSKMPFNKVLLKRVIGEEPPPLETQRSLFYSKVGIFNGFSPSINFADKKIYLSSPQIFDISSKESHFGSISGHGNLEDFVLEAIEYSTRMKKYQKKKYSQAVVEFIKCLKTPENLIPKNVDQYEKGKKLFSKTCFECHDLENGAGSKTVGFGRLNAPEDYINIFKDFKPQDIQSKKVYSSLVKYDLVAKVEELKVRRLKGVWTRSKLTMTGQIDSLEHLFCLNGKNRDASLSDTKLTQNIHLDLCDNYTNKEKKQLLEYLKFF